MRNNIMAQFIEVTNIHDSDLCYGIVCIPTGATVRIFDLTDYGTYGLATFLMYKYFTEIYNDFKNGLIKLTTDEGEFDSISKVDELHTWFKPVSVEHKIGFYDSSVFYFDLIRSLFVVTNPLDGQKYATKLVPLEEIDNG